MRNKLIYAARLLVCLVLAVSVLAATSLVPLAENVDNIVADTNATEEYETLAQNSKYSLLLN